MISTTCAILVSRNDRKFKHIFTFSKNNFSTRANYLLCWSNPVHAPVPLSIFRSNSKFDENSERSSFKYIRPITTIFCTRHDSDTVVTCAKYRCDRPRIFYTRVFWIFFEFDRNMRSGTGARCLYFCHVQYILPSWGIHTQFSLGCVLLRFGTVQFCPDPSGLTHWGRDKMAAILQTTLSNAFSWTKISEFRLHFTEICS